MMCADIHYNWSKPNMKTAHACVKNNCGCVHAFTLVHESCACKVLHGHKL